MFVVCVGFLSLVGGFWAGGLLVVWFYLLVWWVSVLLLFNRLVLGLVWRVFVVLRCWLGLFDLLILGCYRLIVSFDLGDGFLFV